jgi:ABC-type nickel/cobalt efflux system permease component RcnA
MLLPRRPRHRHPYPPPRRPLTFHARVYYRRPVDTSLIPALGLGFALGLRHALDPDHVAAMATLISQERGVLRSCLRGTVWGIGHTTALLAAGIVVLAFKLRIPPAVERVTEILVALVLIGLGGHVLFRTLGAISLHRHQHTHGGTAHSHVHVHIGDAAEHRHVHLWRTVPQPLLMGLLHGLAGSGALILLVLATLPSPTAAVLYVLVFGLGSTAGMLLLSGLIGVPFALALGGSRLMAAALQTIVGAATIAVGALMLHTLLT